VGIGDVLMYLLRLGPMEYIVGFSEGEVMVNEEGARVFGVGAQEFAEVLLRLQGLRKLRRELSPETIDIVMDCAKKQDLEDWEMHMLGRWLENEQAPVSFLDALILRFVSQRGIYIWGRPLSSEQRMALWEVW